MLSPLGLTQVDLGDAVLLAEDGIDLHAAVRRDDESAEVIAVLAGSPGNDRSALANAYLVTRDHTAVPLSIVSQITLTTAPTQIVRQDGERIVEVAVWGGASAVDRAIDGLRALCAAAWSADHVTREMIRPALAALSG